MTTEALSRVRINRPPVGLHAWSLCAVGRLRAGPGKDLHLTII